MAHAQQSEFFSLIKASYDNHFSSAKVIEVGALNINGSVRELFEGGDYIGVDLDAGEGVDFAMPGQLLEFATGRFDTAISAECFEHNPYWAETLANMFRMTRPGGLVIFSCATTGRKEHGTTRSSPESSPFTVAHRWDYYRNLRADDVVKALHLKGWCSDFRFATNLESYDLYFVGLRAGGAHPRLATALVEDMSKRYRPTNTMKSIRRLVKTSVLGDTLS